MDYAMFIIMVTAFLVGAVIQIVTVYTRRKEESAVPKPIDNNIFRVVECTIDEDKTFYILERYNFCNFTKKSSWLNNGRFEKYEDAAHLCKILNDKRKQELEERRINLAIQQTKNKKVMM